MLALHMERDFLALQLVELPIRDPSDSHWQGIHQAASWASLFVPIACIVSSLHHPPNRLVLDCAQELLPKVPLSTDADLTRQAPVATVDRAAVDLCESVGDPRDLLLKGVSWCNVVV